MGRPQRTVRPPKLSPADFATSHPPPKQHSPSPTQPQLPPAPPLTSASASACAPVPTKLTLRVPVANPAPAPSGSSSPLTDLDDSPPNKSDADEPAPASQPASPSTTRSSRRSSGQGTTLKVRLPAPAKAGVRSSKRGRADATEDLTELPAAPVKATKQAKKPRIQEDSVDGSPEPGAPPAVAAAVPEAGVVEPTAKPVEEALLADEVVEVNPVAPLKAPFPTLPERSTKRPSRPLDPAVPAFKPQAPPAALDRTQSGSASTPASPAPPPAMPAPAPASKKSIFAASANPALPFTRKKPGAGAASGPGTPSLFAPKPATPLGRPKPGAAPGAAKADDKGGKIWADLIGGKGKGQLPDARRKPGAEPSKPKKPVMSPAERTADAARRRQAEKAEREQTKKDAFDLLEQSLAMTEFENKYRAEVRAKNARVTAEEGDRFPLPRLTTYGSVFSIWPRAVAAGAPPLSAEPGAGPMEVV